MLEIVIAAIFAAFIAVAAIGHIMLFKALLTPDQSA